MEKRLILFMTIAVYTEPVTGKSQLSTLSIHERIEILKQKLQQNIQRQHGSSVSIFDTEESEEGINESEQNGNFLIPPIMNFDRKKRKYKTTTVKSTAKTKTDKDHMTNSHVSKTSTVESTAKTGKGHTTQSQALRSDLNASLVTTKRKHLTKPVEVFYRRIAKEEDRNMEWKWAHCQDMVTPFLNGIKKDADELKKVSIRDPIVVRLFQLLKENTTTYTKEETYSILYQINNLQLRFFHWDLMSIRALMNILMRGQNHTFRNLKHGLTALLVNWRLDLSNTTNILKQTRIIRPLCTVTSQYTGSTKAQKVSKYKDWLTTPTASDDDE